MAWSPGYCAKLVTSIFRDAAGDCGQSSGLPGTRARSNEMLNIEPGGPEKGTGLVEDFLNGHLGGGGRTTPGAK